MSSLRDGAYIYTIEPGTSWAIVAHSQWPGASGILAGSSDIVEAIEVGDFEILTIFPERSQEIGLYLWTGTYNQIECEYVGTSLKVAMTCADEWINRNGAKP